VEGAVSVKNGPLLAIVELQGNSTFPPFPTEAYFDLSSERYNSYPIQCVLKAL